MGIESIHEHGGRECKAHNDMQVDIFKHGQDMAYVRVGKPVRSRNTKTSAAAAMMPRRAI